MARSTAFRMVFVGPVFLILVLAVFSAPRSELRAEQNSVLNVGFVVPLTGPLSEFGVAIQNGVTLAMDDAHLADRFKPVFEDSRYESLAATGAFQKLTAVDRVALSYVFGGPMSETLAPIAEAKRQVMVSTEYSPDLTRGRKYVIRFANTATDFADTLLRKLRSRGYHRFAIVRCENQYHNTLFSAFQARLAADEELIVVGNYLPGEQDFRSAVTKLRTQKFDALGLYLLPGMQNAFVRQLQSSSSRYPLFGTDTFETDGENVGVEEAVSGAMYANATVEPEFRKRYREHFGNESQLVHAALAYEFMRLLGQRVTGETNAEQIVELLSTTPEQRGSLGNYRFSSSPEEGMHFEFPLSVKETLKSNVAG